MEDIALALHVEAVHIAHHRQHLRQSHILELDGDQPGHPGVNRHAVAGALEQGTEKLHRLHIVSRDTQQLLRHADRHLRPVQLQQFTLHRFGQSGQRGSLFLLFVHGLFEGILGLGRLGVLIRGTACSHHGHGDQTETVFFHVIRAP